MHAQIIQLKNLVGKHHLHVDSDNQKKDGLIHVRFHVENKIWELFIEDEYNDLDTNNQIISAYLVLLALDNYKCEKDFTDWCRTYNLDSGSAFWLNYYKDLAIKIPEIESIIGKIDPIIPALDYTLRSGAFMELKNL